MDLSMLWPLNQPAPPSQVQITYLTHPGRGIQPCTKQNSTLASMVILTCYAERIFDLQETFSNLFSSLFKQVVYDKFKILRLRSRTSLTVSRIHVWHVGHGHDTPDTCQNCLNTCSIFIILFLLGHVVNTLEHVRIILILGHFKNPSGG